MKVLILADRRKREETDGTRKLTETFLQGMYIAVRSKKGDNLKAEKVHINPCKGCNSCWQGSSGKCVNIGNMDDISKKFLEAEYVIWSLPLFYYGSPSIMKAFVGIKSKPQQKHVVISASGFSAAGNNYDELNKQFSDMYKENFVTILCSQGEVFAIPKLQKKTNEYLVRVRKAAAEYIVNGSFSKKIANELSLPVVPMDIFQKIKNQGKK